MTQIFSPSNANNKQEQLYCYINRQATVIIARIECFQNRHCERVIFPQEKFLFVADDDCDLEIYQHTNIGIIKDVIPCKQLKIK